MGVSHPELLQRSCKGGRTTRACERPDRTQCGPTNKKRGLPMHAKKPGYLSITGLLLNKCLTMTYSRMGRPHTTIGAERFHF